MTTRPLVSIVTPVYNAGVFLRECIGSVASQTYENWELILVNDGSTDNSLEIIKGIASHDTRIIVHSSVDNRGVAQSRNIGIDKAKGDFIAFLDADDYWHPEKLQKQLAFIKQSSSVFTYCGYSFVNSDSSPSGVVVRPPATVNLTQYLKDNIIWTTTVMVDMRSVKKDDLMMADVSYGEDALTWLRLLDKYGQAEGLEETLAYYRRGGESLTSNKIKAALNKLRLYAKLEYVGFPKSMHYFISSLLAAVRKRLR